MTTITIGPVWERTLPRSHLPRSFFLEGSCIQTNTLSPVTKGPSDLFTRCAKSLFTSSNCLAWRCDCKASLLRTVSLRSSIDGSAESWSGFMFSTSSKSGGRLPVASSSGQKPLLVSCVFLAQQHILTTWRKVAFAKIASS